MYKSYFPLPIEYYVVIFLFQNIAIDIRQRAYIYIIVLNDNMHSGSGHEILDYIIYYYYY